MKKLLFLALAFVFPGQLFAQNINSDFVGVYKFEGAPFEKIVVSISGNSVFAEAEGVGKGEIFATKNKDEFTEPNNNAVLVFNRDATGNVTSLTVKVQGSELRGVKQPNAKNEYLGKYRFDDGSAIASMTISLQNGELYGETDQGSAVLKGSSRKDIFEIIGYDGTVEFLRDSTGNVKKVILKVNDMVLNGEKL